MSRREGVRKGTYRSMSPPVYQGEAQHTTPLIFNTGKQHGTYSILGNTGKKHGTHSILRLHHSSNTTPKGGLTSPHTNNHSKNHGNFTPSPKPQVDAPSPPREPPNTTPPAPTVSISSLAQHSALAAVATTAVTGAASRAEPGLVLLHQGIQS